MQIEMKADEWLDIKLPDGNTLNIECIPGQCEIVRQDGTIVYKTQQAGGDGELVRDGKDS